MRMPRAALAAGMIVLAGCATRPPPQPIAVPQVPPLVAEAEQDAQVRATVLGGTAPVPQGSAAPARAVRGGPIAVNLPAADVRAVAASVASLTGTPIAVDAGVNAQVSLVSPGRVARSELIGLLETALRAANLALVPEGEGFAVRPAAAAQSPVAPGVVGFGTEVVRLQFINADEVRKVIDGALPGVVTATDPAGNTLTLAGTTGQRSSARDLIRQFDVNWLRNMSFALFVPERTDARLIVPELEKLINAPDAPTRGLVRLIAMERLNGILAVSAQRQYLEDVRRWIEVLDREGESAEPRVFVYRVQNGRARDLARTLNRAIGGGDADAGDEGDDDPFAAPEGPPKPPGTAPAAPAPQGNAPAQPAQQDAAPAQAGARITADEVNNAVIVYGRPRDYATVEDALRRLDVAPYQVLIEAAITEVTLNDTLRYGVQWQFLTGDSNFRLTDGAALPAGPTAPGFSYFLSGRDITATLNALERRTNIKVVSAPKLVVLNNQTAALQVGDQVPISAGNAVSVENPNAPIVNSIVYRDTGVILKVTPRVNAGGLVLLDVSQEVSDVNTTSTAGVSTTEASPTISTRRISTSVAVQDGQVIALGGLFRNAESFGKDGVPILSRIPVLGALFGSQNKVTNRTELIVLLKPQVIRTPDDGRAITEELRAKLRTLEPFRTEGKIP
jgi:general secretion pathway protein D